MIIIEPEFNEKQKVAIKHLFKQDGVNEVLFGGGAGSGKSWLGCVFIIVMAIKYPETRYLIGRSKLSQLKQTTLRTFFDVAKQLNLKDEKHFNYNAQSNVITFFNGSEVILKDLFSYPSDPDFDGLGSLEITAAFIDEVPQVSEKAKNIVLSRIRYKLDENGLEPKLYMSCNPSKGWLYNQFYKKHKDNVLEPYKVFIPALPTDNPHISKHYINNLQKLDKVSRDRLLYGKWEYSDDLSVFDYDAIIDLFTNEKPIDLEKKYQYYFAVDVARLGKDSTVIMVMRDDFTLVEVITLKKKNVKEVVDFINNLKKKYNIGNNANIAIDADGVGGGVVDYLPGCKSIVNNSKALNGENYQNLKTQLIAKLAELINSGGLGCNTELDIELQNLITQELMVIKREDVDKDGPVKYTKKEEIKKVLGRSPDYSDALAYLMIHNLNITYVNDFDIEIWEF